MILQIPLNSLDIGRAAGARITVTAGCRQHQRLFFALQFGYRHPLSDIFIQQIDGTHDGGKTLLMLFGLLVTVNCRRQHLRRQQAERGEQGNSQ